MRTRRAAVIIASALSVALVFAAVALADTIRGTQGDDANLTGTTGDDVIVGTDARDTIEGGAGDDTICALGGDDTVRGGAGDDRLFGGLDGVYVADDDFWGDVVVPGPGDDHVDLGHDPQGEDLWWGDSIYLDRVSFRDATGPVTVDMAAGTATGEGDDTIAPVVLGAGIEGSPHDDVLRGTDLDDQVDAIDRGVDAIVDGYRCLFALSLTLPEERVTASPERIAQVCDLDPAVVRLLANALP